MGIFDFLFNSNSQWYASETTREISADEIPLDILLAVERKSNGEKYNLNKGYYSLDEIKGNGYVLRSGGNWQFGTNYLSHPVLKNEFIEASRYKDFILREILNDISGFILDHFAIENLAIGIVQEYNSTREGGFSISVKNINANANYDLQISSEYNVSFRGLEKSKNPKKHIWIDNFPEVKMAVEHNAKGFERVEKLNSVISASINAEFVAFGANVNGKNSDSLSVYISYSR